MTAVIRNTFGGKLLRDALEYKIPNGSYRWALNAVHQDRDARLYGGLVSEESMEEAYSFAGEVKGAKYVESIDSSIYFVGDAIHIFDHKTEEGKLVASASEFGCTWKEGVCDDIVPTFKTMQPCSELHMYWSQGCTLYTMNITEMLDPVRKEALKTCIQAGQEDGCGFGCDYFELMKINCVPRISPVVATGGGHSLESGVYQFAARLEDRSGNTTNWSWVSAPVSVGSKNNIGGEISEHSIDVHITDLDCKYSRVHIAVVKTVNGVKTQEVVSERGYSTDGITFRYYGQFVRPLGELTELTAKKKRYIRAKEIIQKDGRAWIYKVRQEKNPNMQKRVSDSATVSFVEVETTAKAVEKYNMTTHERGENYLYGVVYNFTDETNTASFLLTQGGGGGGAIEEARVGDIQEDIQEVVGGVPEPSGTAIKFERVRTKPPQFPAEDAADAAVNAAVSTWDTDFDDLTESMKCDDCQEPYCCDGAGNCYECAPDPEVDNNCEGCTENEEAAAADGPKLENVLTKHLDELSSASQDHNELISSGSFKEGVDNFVRKTVEEAEVIQRTKTDFTISAVPPVPALTPLFSTGDDSVLFADQYVNSKGESVIEDVCEVVAVHAPIIVESTELYPDTKDCLGQPLYGGLAGAPVKLFQTPDASVSPFLVAGSNGVPSRENPAIDPIYNNKIRLLGLRVEGVPMPASKEEEIEWFGKPLCPHQPYRIVMVQRDHMNSTVQAKAIVGGTFQGVSNGKTYAIPRNGANGPTLLDRFINDDGSRIGTDGTDLIYVAYGLDTEISRSGLSATKFRLEGIFSGIGHRYGLYGVGKEPDNKLTGNRIDQRGYRGAVNINVFTPSSLEADIQGLSYVDSDSVGNAPAGVTLDLLNRYRESCVYFELDTSLGLEVDKSMISDGLDHEAPIKSANMAYGSFIREIPDQYGSVVGMKFIDTGIVAHANSGNDVQGIVGDTFIGPNVFTRKSYISDKVGDTYPLQAAGYERDRTVCDSPDDAIFEQLGINYYPTRLPESGDKSDARNWANGFYGMDQEPADWATAADEGFADVDIYYPKTQTTLIYSFVESRVNPWLRASGVGEDEIFVPKLKRWYLDANSEDGHPWEESYLNRFHYNLEQPSVSQMLKKAFYKIIINSIVPLLGTWGMVAIGGVPSAVGFFIAALATIGQWQFYKKIFGREDYLNKLLGIKTCYTDSEGGEEDNNIEGFENNFWSYNYNHSMGNEVNIYYSMPLIYNTCDCDDCVEEDETTNEVFFSNKQIEGSPFDAYQNFKAFNYTEISADSGKLEDLFVWNGALYAQTTDGLHLVKFAPVTTQTSLGTSILGGNDLLVDPQIYLEGVVEGFAGTLDPKASMNTSLGRIMIDRKAGKVYRFDGAIEDIGSIGMHNFWKEMAEYCEPSDCEGYRRDGKNFYTTGYDPLYNRIMITKNDSKYPFTLSYDPFGGDNKGWISFHSYIPQRYVWDRKNLFSVKDGKLWKHNKKGSYGNFYGEQQEFGVQFTANIPSATGELDWFTYVNTIINSEVDQDRKTLDKTVDTIAVWNTTQKSGTKIVETISDNAGVNENMASTIEENCHIKAIMGARKFVINELHDNTKEGCNNKPATLREECEPYENINESVTDETPPNIQNNRQKLIKDDHLIYRLTYKSEGSRMRLLDVATKINT